VVAALELYFDTDATRRIRNLWTAMEAAGVPSLKGLTHGKHRPHLSLVAADQLDGDAVLAALGDFDAAPPLRITLDHIGLFIGRVLFLGPTPTVELLGLQSAVHGRLERAGIEVFDVYRPGAWVPHSTMSMRVPHVKLPDGLRLCMDMLPLEATIVGGAVADHVRDHYVRLPGR
jgi:hypothetical protein